MEGFRGRGRGVIGAREEESFGAAHISYIILRDVAAWRTGGGEEREKGRERDAEGRGERMVCQQN